MISKVTQAQKNIARPAAMAVLCVIIANNVQNDSGHLV